MSSIGVWGRQLTAGIAAGLVGASPAIGLAIASSQQEPAPAQVAEPPGRSDVADPAPAHVIVGAGDIAECQNPGDELTAHLLDGIDGTVFTLGDNVYDSGTPNEFADCYHPSWGRHRERTRPVPGNHDYETPNASGYFEYFGERAGEAGEGYYAYSVGDWSVYALNSNCDEVGGCDPASRQYQWLASRVSTDDADCSIAYWHDPILTASSAGESDAVLPLVEVLYHAGVEMLLTASSHSYERLAPLAPDRSIDRDRGIRVFVVGTGGAGLRPLGPPLPATEASDDRTHGVLKLDLNAGWYEWEFIPADGNFQDRGVDTCH